MTYTACLGHIGHVVSIAKFKLPEMDDEFVVTSLRLGLPAQKVDELVKIDKVRRGGSRSEFCTSSEYVTLGFLFLT